MNVHLYQVKRDEGALPLAELLAHVAGLPLEGRIKSLSTGDFRLEHVEPPRSEHNNTDYWLLDFVKLRFENGPGKVGKSTAVTGFQFGEDEGFGEETAVLYDPKLNHMVVQYNHHGMRASAIERYFNSINHDPDEVTSYELLIKMDPSAEIRLAQKKYITKLKLKISPPKMTPAHRAAGVSLDQILALNNDQNGGSIEIAITAAKGETLADKALTFIDGLRRLAAHDIDEGTDVVSRFEVEGKNDLLDRADAINMLTPKLQFTIGDLMLGGDRRYTRRSRWDGLLKARQGWRDIIQRAGDGANN